MKIRYCPCRYNVNAPHVAGVLPNTSIVIRNENTIEIDGVPYEFAAEDVAWEGLTEATRGVILDARRDELGELCLIVRRFYTQLRAWDDGQYHTVVPEAGA